MKLDRFGYARCDGYRSEDFVLCDRCLPDGKIDESKLKTSCKLCGGYGEYPKPAQVVPAAI